MTHYLVSKYNMSSDCKTQEIVTAFVEIIDIDKNYELKDYKRIISDIFNNIETTKKKTSPPVIVEDEESDEDDDKPKRRGRPPNKKKLDKNGNEKVKRPPSVYNIFVQHKIKELKIMNNQDTKDLMVLAAAEWKKLTKEEKDDFKQKMC
jgi:hypothetical protein